jgi:hypothetical protein
LNEAALAFRNRIGSTAKIPLRRAPDAWNLVAGTTGVGSPVSEPWAKIEPNGGRIMWKILNPLSIVILAIGLGVSAPARAEKIVYTFTSSEGDFVYVSPSYFDYGELSLGQLYSYSFPALEEINGVAFDGIQGEYSTVYLGQDDCINTDSCFTSDFGPNGFYALGTYHDQYTGATLVVSTGVPEASTWAMMILGFVGLGAAWRVRRATNPG